MAVAPIPYRSKQAEDVIKGKGLNKITIEQGAKAAMAHAKPLSRNAYKVEIEKTLIRKALSSVDS